MLVAGEGDLDFQKAKEHDPYDSLQGYFPMAKSYKVVTRFSLSKEVSPGTSEIEFGKYRFFSIPSIRGLFKTKEEEAILEFVDVWEENQTYSNPEEEARYVLAVLSLLLRTQVKFHSMRTNNVNVTFETSIPKRFLGKITIPKDFHELYEKLYSLKTEVLKCYLRSVRIYQTAISLTREDPTLSFFLLTVAIECLSNNVIEGGSHQERFEAFIRKYLPSELESERQHLNFLDQAYKVRSLFTHRGRDISTASILADRAEIPVLKHFVKGKEVRTPSLSWFERVVQGALVNFLRRQKIKKIRKDLAELARERGVIYLKSKKPLTTGRLVTKEDVELS